MSYICDMDYEFEDCLGNIYARIIKEAKLNAETLENVVEFAPGFRYKIACALKRIDFRGNLYVIDLNKDVLEYVYNKYKEIIPEANIICLKCDLKESIKELHKNIDLFLSNHCIDDMIIGEFVGNGNRDLAFGNKEISKEYLINKWSELEGNPLKLKEIKEKIYNEFVWFIRNINVKFYIMSQYKSAFYIKETSRVEDNAKDIFNRLKEEFIINMDNLKNAMDFYIEDFDAAAEYEELRFKNNIQNVDNWIAGKVR